MSRYDDLFEDATVENSVFADKGALDPLAEPTDVVPRTKQEKKLAGLLTGVQEGHLPTTISVYGPPGTGKTLTTRRLCQEFAARTAEFEYEYVNLKECRTLFAAANEIHRVLTGETKGAHAGLDGVFEGIWTALEAYPAWTVLILDEIDHIQQDSNYEPTDFFYRLLRGEGKLKRDLHLSVVLVSNELLDVDLRLDSRVQSAMSGEEVFFPPYGTEELQAVMAPRLEQAFREGALPDEAGAYGVQLAADRWGDARRTLRLFRRAGETANDRGREQVTRACVDTNMTASDREATVEKITQLPRSHVYVLVGATAWTDRQTGRIVQPVSTAKITTVLQREGVPERFQLGARAVRDVLTDLETMGLVETWVESRGANGRVKQVETTFDPQFVREAQANVAAEVGDTSGPDSVDN